MRLGNQSVERDAGVMRVLVGAVSGTPTTPTSHSDLDDLGNDDHSQYVHISSARTITVAHTFNPSSPGAPFLLGANAADELVTGLNADLLDGLHAGAFIPSSRQIIAGAGLTGGGDLSADRTIDVAAADTSMTINADSIQVRLATNSGLTISSGLLLGTPSAVTVASTNAVTGSVHSHAATSSSNPGAAASLLASDANGYLRLIRLGLGGLATDPAVPLHVIGSSEILRFGPNATDYAKLSVDVAGTVTLATVTSGAGGNVVIAPAGDVIVDPGGNDAYPLTNYDVNLGLINKKWLTLHAAELWVETLVAQDTIATIGGRVMVAPTTTLTEDLGSSGAAGTITAVAGATAVSSAGKVSSLACNKPTGTAEGDLMIAFVVIRGDSQSVTLPADWTLLDTTINTSPAVEDLTTTVCYKFATGSEPANYTWSFSVSGRTGIGIYAFRGVHATSPVNAWGVGQVASGTSITVNAVTTTSDNCFVLTFTGAAATETLTPPGTEMWDVNTNSPDQDITNEAGYQEQASAGSTGNKQTTIVSGSSRTLTGYIVALAPAAGGVPSTITTKHNQMRPGDTVLAQANGFIEWMSVASGPTGTGPYTYTVTRNLDRTGANDWPAGTALVNTGTTGSGFIDLYSLESVLGTPPEHIYNYDAGATAFSANYADDSNWTLFGDNANTGVNDCIYFGVENTSWENLNFMVGTAGVYTATLTWEFWNGSAWTSFVPNPTTDFKSTGLKPVTWSAAALTGWARTTINSVLAYWVRCSISAFTSWTTQPVQAGRRVYRYKSQFGPTIVGWIRNSTTFNDLSEGWAIGNLNGLYGYGADTYGVGLGKYANSQSFVTIDATNGVRLMKRLAGVDVAHIWLQNDGDVFIGENVASPGTTNFAIFTAAQTYNGESMSAGDFLIGDNSASKANIFWDKSAGKLQFRGGQTMKCEIGTSGALVAGGGSVELNQNGIEITAWSESISTAASYHHKVGSDVVSYYGVYTIADDDLVNTVINGGHTVALLNSTFNVAATAGTGGTALLELSAHATGGDLARIDIESQVTGAITCYAGRFIINSGPLIMGAIASVNNTNGLTINQDTADDEILTLQSNDVGHGMTSLTETQTYGRCRKVSATVGGLQIDGFTEDTYGLVALGVVTNVSTAKSNTAEAAVVISAVKKSGTSSTSMDANSNLLAVRNGTATRMLVDADGDLHLDGTSNPGAWDEYDDIALLTGLRASLMPEAAELRKRFADWMEYARPVLEQTGVVSYNEDGHHFVSLKGLHMLEIDAMRQLHERMERIELALGLM